MSYLSWDKKIISDFSEENCTALYDQGYVFVRPAKGMMKQTRSVRIALDGFELTSENRRVLRKVAAMDLASHQLPYADYSWELGKLCKDFYDTKFGIGTFSANKAKDLITNPEASNFNALFAYTIDAAIGYAICYENESLLHYSYPFYDLDQSPKNMGMGMMLMAIEWAQQKNKQYIYLGSAQRPTDTYKLQFNNMQWFNGTAWQDDMAELKSLLLA